MPVIAQATAHNAEIAGGALRGFRVGSIDSMTTAVSSALESPPEPDPDAFDRDAYFDWLLGLSK
jgi:hypothetical protein